VPCHRSHVDYLLLSYIIFNRGLMVPHIAAGANLNLPVVGSILRRSGAFFLRRKIKGEPLYAAVFLEYLHMMIDRGFPIEYFIEGGRSRSGRMLAPKAGILAMTVQSFVRSRARPLVFVPVYIGYEKLMEGKSYIAELTAGRRNPSRCSAWSARRLLRRNFGKVHVNFGPPLALAGVPRRAASGLARGSLRYPGAVAARRRRCHGDAAGAQHQCRGGGQPGEPGRADAAVHAQACGRPAPAGARSGTSRHCWRAALGRLDHPLRIPAEQVIACYAPARLRRNASRIRSATSSAPTKSRRRLLAYFRNNVLHLLALPALLACLVSHNQRLPRPRAREAIRGIYGLLRTELFLPWEAGDLDAVIERSEAALARRGLILTEAEVLRAPPPNSEASPELRQLGEIIRPTLERHS
jgi:glycerol-3-phosphate O-acyltransferase